MSSTFFLLRKVQEVGSTMSTRFRLNGGLFEDDVEWIVADKDEWGMWMRKLSLLEVGN